MGSGKSSVGRKLSALLAGMCKPEDKDGRVCLLDLDDYIVIRSGRTIPEIFAADGESGFRAVETKCLEEVLDWSDGKQTSEEAVKALPQVKKPDVLVLSLGGGAVIKNSELIHDRTICVFLIASIDTLVDRLDGRTANRPLLAAESRDSLKAKVEGILEARKSLYEKAARFVLNTDGMSVTEAAQEVIRLLSGRQD